MTAVDYPAPAAVSAAVADPPVAVRRTGRWLVRGVLWSGLVLAFVTTSFAVGLPTDRVVVLSWVVAGLGVHAVTEGWRRVVRLVTDWSPLVILLLAYDATRGVADSLGIAVHVTEPVAADRWLGGGTVPTVWLQAHWQAPWWLVVASLVYASHFVVTPLVLGVLWVRNRRAFAHCARLVVALSAAGLLTYVLYPAAPPWLAARDGVIPPVQRLSAAGWAVLDMPRARGLLHTGQAGSNQVAAIPSLHTAFAVLVCLMLLPLARRVWQRVALVSYAVLMPVVLVWAGEHYVVDTLLGALYAAGTVALMAAAERGIGRLVRRRRPATLAA